MSGNYYLHYCTYTWHVYYVQSEAEQLEKAHKTAAEQKEQLQHELLKIKQDLQSMKSTYEETSSSVISLISNSDVRGSSEDIHPPAESQLRRLNQLYAARVEKTEKEVKGKLVEVDKAKQQIQSRIRYSKITSLMFIYSLPVAFLVFYIII